MNTITDDNESNLMVAETYYHQMLQKNFDAMEACLDSDVHFIGPLAEISGKTRVVEAAKNLSHILGNIEIRAKFSFGNQIMFAYDFIFPEPIGKLRAAVLMEFKNKLIAKIEVFYDGRLFSEEKKGEIFSNKED